MQLLPLALSALNGLPTFHVAWQPAITVSEKSFYYDQVLCASLLFEYTIKEEYSLLMVLHLPPLDRTCYMLCFGGGWRYDMVLTS